MHMTMNFIGCSKRSWSYREMMVTLLYLCFISDLYLFYPAVVRVKAVNATALLVSWDVLKNSHHYTIYYSAFSPELFKVVDESTTVVPSTRTSDIVVIRELTAGVEHQFQVTASLEVQGVVYESGKSIPTRIVIGKIDHNHLNFLTKIKWWPPRLPKKQTNKECHYNQPQSHPVPIFSMGWDGLRLVNGIPCLSAFWRVGVAITKSFLIFVRNKFCF